MSPWLWLFCSPLTLIVLELVHSFYLDYKSARPATAVSLPDVTKIATNADEVDSPRSTRTATRTRNSVYPARIPAAIASGRRRASLHQSTRQQLQTHARKTNKDTVAHA